MKTSLQFFKDMGVCDGAYAVLERVFGQAGVTEFDYAQGYQLMLGMLDQLEVDAAQSGEPGHDTAQGWLQWCYDLRSRPEAIMYFGDHIEENQFRTVDGQLHETLEAAQDHDRSRYAELRQDHAAARVINGVRFGEGGAETWEVVDPQPMKTARNPKNAIARSAVSLRNRRLVGMRSKRTSRPIATMLAKMRKSSPVAVPDTRRPHQSTTG